MAMQFHEVPFWVNLKALVVAVGVQFDMYLSHGAERWLNVYEKLHNDSDITGGVSVCNSNETCVVSITGNRKEC